MKSTTDTQWARSLEQLAGRLDYPPTPDVAAAVRQAITSRQPAVPARPGSPRPVAVRLAWATVGVALLALALLAVPQTRAAVLSFFARVGAIDIFIDETAPTTRPTTAPAQMPTATPIAGATRPTPASVPSALALIDLGKPATLDEATRRLGFAPHLPAALGEPDEVYLHGDVGLPAVTLVWRGPDGEPLSLTEIAVAEFARKLVSEDSVRETTVNGAVAMWLPGPHTLHLFGDWQPNPIPITSSVLIWTGDGYTFRLEGDLTLAEAQRIAESVAPPATPIGD